MQFENVIWWKRIKYKKNYRFCGLFNIQSKSNQTTSSGLSSAVDVGQINLKNSETNLFSSWKYIKCGKQKNAPGNIRFVAKTSDISPKTSYLILKYQKRPHYSESSLPAWLRRPGPVLIFAFDLL